MRKGSPLPARLPRESGRVALALGGSSVQFSKFFFVSADDTFLCILTRGVTRISHCGATEAERQRRRGKGVVIGKGFPHSQPTSGSGERRELPQRGPPTHLRIFGIFEAHRTLLVERTVLL